MGTWGTGLYQSDDAKDLKSDLVEWLGVPITPEEVVAGLRMERHVTDPPRSAEDCVFWLVLADQLHRFGIEVAEVTAKATMIIDEDVDLTVQAELGLDEPGLTKRRDVLAGLKEKWSTPAAKPSKRKLLKREPQLLQTGQVYSYPTMDGNAQFAPVGRAAIEAYRFKPDGTNAFVVLNEARYFHDLFARAFIAPLAIFRDGGSIGLDDCLDAAFLCEASFLNRTFRPVGGWVAMGAKKLKLIGATQIGQVEIDSDQARRIFGDALCPPQTRFMMDFDPLHVNMGIHNSFARGSIWGEEASDLRDLISD